MDMYGQKDKSIPQKTVMKLFEFIILAVSFRILFGNGYAEITGNRGAPGYFHAARCFLFLTASSL